MEINGKIYRNLEGQVAYLTEKWDDLQDQINDIKGKLTHYIIVEELPVDPEDIDTSAVYLVGPKGTAPDTYYEEWVYVQLEDESWTWEKLGDTASVDLSGYLEKQTGTTSYIQAYCKLQNGSQGMASMSPLVTGAGYIIMRDTDGQINVPQTPSSSEHATSKKYVDDNFIAKSTSTTTYDRLYGVYGNGTQTMFNVSEGANAYTVAMRDSAGKVLTKDPVNSSDAVNLSYANDHYLAKQTGSTSYSQVYTKNADGTQGMANIANGGTSAYTIVQRDGGGRITCATPQNSTDAANKDYVDAVVGQLIYHHDMVIIYTLTGDTDYVKIAAHSDNNTSTAFTGIDWHNMPLIMPDYAVYHHGSNDYLASVTKLPRGLHQDEFSEPRDGFLLTYWDGSALQNVRVNESLFNTPTVTDVVTTW